MSKSSQNKRKEEKKKKALEIKSQIKKDKYSSKNDSWNDKYQFGLIREEPVKISQARENRLKLENLCVDDLSTFIESKVKYSTPLYRKNISSELIDYSQGGVDLPVGIRLTSQNGEIWELGFDLYKNDLNRTKIKVVYGPVHLENLMALYQEKAFMLPKNLSSSKLLKLIKFS
jgi:hypothetical protein